MGTLNVEEGNISGLTPAEKAHIDEKIAEGGMYGAHQVRRNMR